MGNLMSSSVQDEENIVTSLLDAASKGAREAVVKAFVKAAQQSENYDEEPVLIGRVLPVHVAQDAAADAIKEAIDLCLKDLNCGKYQAYDTEAMKAATVLGTKEGLKTVVAMSELVHHDIEAEQNKEISLEIAAAAAGVGAWIACLISTETRRNQNQTRYSSILVPMFGSSFPASVAIYNLISESSDFVKSLCFGGTTLCVFLIASALAAIALGRTKRSAAYSRYATLAAVLMVLVMFTCALLVLFESSVYQIIFGVVFGALILLLVFIWIRMGW